MAGNLTTAVVGTTPGVIYGAPGSTQEITVLNLDTVNTVWLGYSASMGPAVGGGGIPVGPGASMQFDGSASIYAVATASVIVAVGPGVTGYFLPASLANIGGSKVYVQAGEPAGTIPVNSVWFNTANGSLQTYDGTDWDNQAFNAQQLIQAATILGTQIASQAVTAAKVANGTLTTAQLAAAAGILGAQIAAATVTGSNIAANTIVAANIAANTITAAQIAAATITGSNIAASTITAANIAAATITATQIAASTITASQIAAGAIGTSQLAANAVTAAKIAAGTITATQIAATTITAAQIAAGTVTSAQIAAGTIAATNILANTITAGQIAAGSLTNGTLAAWAVDGVISTASFHGLNMIPDTQFSNATVNAARQADPVTAGTWTLGSGEAVVVERASANILALVSSAEKPFWVNPGEQYYYSITVNRSGSSTSQIGLQFVGATTVTESTAAAGTTTLSGVFTVPSGWTSMYLRIFTNPDATHTDTITFTSPVVQPASLFSPTIYGTDYIINPNGAFFYSGTPAAGNLLIAIANSSGSDAYGNPYYEGIAVFQPNGQSVFIGPDGGTPVIQMTPASTAHMLAPPQAFASAISAGGAAEQLAVAMSSGTESGNTSMTAGFTLISGANNGSQAAVFNAYAGPVSLQLKNNNAQVTTGGGLAGNPVLSQCDLSSNTAGSTSYSDVTKDWAIPANDAQVGTVYRLKVYGSGAEASGTSVLLGLQILGFGNSEAPTGMAAGVIAAGTGFSWWAEAVIIVKNTGASGTAEYSMHGAIALNGRASASSSASFSGHNTTVSINTTAATTMSIQAAWGSVSGSPTVTGFSSTFERMGP